MISRGVEGRWPRRLRMKPPPNAAAQHKHESRIVEASRLRLIAARVLTILAVLVAFVGMLSFAVERTVLDEGGVERIATDLIRDDAIRQQGALAAVEQLYANVDVEQAIAQRLPEAQRGLAPTLAGLSRQAADEGAKRILQRPRAHDPSVEVVTTTDRQLVLLLEDEGKLIRTEGGKVVLDLRPIIVEVGDQVAIIGRAADRLPASTGRIAVVDADQLDTAQTAVSVLRALSAWLWALAIVLAVAAVWLARGRRRLELRALAIGFLAVGLLLLFARRAGGGYIVDELTNDATRPAGWSTWSIATQELADRAWVWITGGAIILAGVWLVGPLEYSSARTRGRRAGRRECVVDVRHFGRRLARPCDVRAAVRPLDRGEHRSAVLAAVGVETVRRMIRTTCPAVELRTSRPLPASRLLPRTKPSHGDGGGWAAGTVDRAASLVSLSSAAIGASSSITRRRSVGVHDRRSSQSFTRTESRSNPMCARSKSLARHGGVEEGAFRQFAHESQTSDGARRVELEITVLELFCQCFELDGGGVRSSRRADVRPPEVTADERRERSSPVYRRLPRRVGEHLGDHVRIAFAGQVVHEVPMTPERSYSQHPGR